MSYILFIGLIFCHFLADYTHLSTNWMLSAKRLGKPLYPIFTHAFIHASLMLVLSLAFTLDKSKLIFTFLFQLTTHFLIDVWKGRMNGWFPELQSPANKCHWVIFGLDQTLHFTVIFIIYQNIISLWHK